MHRKIDITHAKKCIHKLEPAIVKPLKKERFLLPVSMHTHPAVFHHILAQLHLQLAGIPSMNTNAHHNFMEFSLHTGTMSLTVQRFHNFATCNKDICKISGGIAFFMN